MTKIVINTCYGGFSLSPEAVLLAQSYADKNSKWHEVSPAYGYLYDVPRHDPILIRVVEELGVEKASGKVASLEIVDIGNIKNYTIYEYDGLESLEPFGASSYTVED